MTEAFDTYTEASNHAAGKAANDPDSAYCMVKVRGYLVVKDEEPAGGFVRAISKAESRGYARAREQAARLAEATYTSEQAAIGRFIAAAIREMRDA